MEIKGFDAIREEEKKGRLIENRAQWFSFIIVLVFALIALYAIFKGHAWEGTIILGANLVALISVFLFRKRQESINLEEGTATEKAHDSPDSNSD